MTCIFRHNGFDHSVDLSDPIDISIPLKTHDNPIAWYLNLPEIAPVRFGDWVGKVSEGASTNFNTITFNPHGHGTHTECLGHITKEFYSINQHLKTFFFVAELVTIFPEEVEGDYIILRRQLEQALAGKCPQAVVIRTLPNDFGKLMRNYSHTNPPYLEAAAAVFLRELGVDHLLIDLPSVDREQDEGRLAAHRAFWNLNNVDEVNEDARFHATITELVYVPDSVADGSYLLNLQIASFENDASPSKPVLYRLQA